MLYWPLKREKVELSISQRIFAKVASIGFLCLADDDHTKLDIIRSIINEII